MKIGIIVYSQTGNTNSVAEKLKEKLQAMGHTVNVERLTTVGGVQKDAKNIRIEKLPDLGAYDALVFGAPVQAFSLAPAMAVYMTQLPSLGGKKIACFVTKGLPFSWTGGNRALKQMKKRCEAMGGKVSGTGIVYWSSKERENHIGEVVNKLSGFF